MARPTEHVGGPHHDGITDDAGHFFRLFEGRGNAVLGLGQIEFLEEGLELLPVLGDVDAFGRGADDVHPGLLQGHGEVERGLAAELDDHARPASPASTMSRTFSRVSGSK